MLVNLLCAQLIVCLLSVVYSKLSASINSAIICAQRRTFAHSRQNSRSWVTNGEQYLSKQRRQVIQKAGSWNFPDQFFVRHKCPDACHPRLGAKLYRTFVKKWYGWHPQYCAVKFGKLLFNRGSVPSLLIHILTHRDPVGDTDVSLVIGICAPILCNRVLANDYISTDEVFSSKLAYSYSYPPRSRWRYRCLIHCDRYQSLFRHHFACLQSEQDFDKFCTFASPGVDACPSRAFNIY